MCLIIGITLYAQIFMQNLDKRIPKGYALSDNLNNSDSLMTETTFISGYFQSEGVVSYQNVQLPVNILSTINDISGLLQENMLEGSFYTESIVPEENCFAVVDEELANRLFLGSDVCGRSIMINGKDYQVCGVLRRENSFIERMSNEFDVSVYIAANSSAGNNLDEPLFWCPKTENIQNKARAAEVMSQYGKKFVDANSIVDMSVLVQLNRAVTNVMLLFVPFSICIFVVQIVTKRVKCRYNEVVALIKKIFTMIVIASQVIVFAISSPEQILPSDNFFEIQHYLDVLIDLMRIGITAGGQLYSYISQSVYSFVFLTWLLVIVNLVYMVQIGTIYRRGK